MLRSSAAIVTFRCFATTIQMLSCGRVMGPFLLEKKSTKGISALILVKLLVFTQNILVFGEGIERALLNKKLTSPQKYCQIPPKASGFLTFSQ